jgi:hypothetical protein
VRVVTAPLRPLRRLERLWRRPRLRHSGPMTAAVAERVSMPALR